jgi:Ni/Co efflux regulator RcnB
MRSRKWLTVFAVGVFVLTSHDALAQGNGNGNGHGNGHNKHSEDADRDDRYYSDRDVESAHRWYSDHENNLPPGLAKRDRLPPGLEKQLVRRGTLPPGLHKRLVRCPEDLERRLPPPPPECEHVLVGGHIVLLNQRTNVVVDVVHFEIH